MSIRSADNQVDNIIDIDAISKIEKNIIISIPSFLPTDLPELELWLDANEGIINTLGNNFTDETASIILAGFPINNDISPPLDPNTTLLKNPGQINGKNYYSSSVIGGDWGGQVTVNWNGSVWQLIVVENFEDGYGETIYTATGDTEYPWQATWADGTVTRTATTFDVPATNDETVTRWVNKVSGKPSLDQNTLASQPVFKSDVNGRKAVYFNEDALSSSGFSIFTREYSYYLVTDTLEIPAVGTVRAAIRLGTSTISIRGLFGANISYLGANNGTARTSFISKQAFAGAVWSARFDIASNQVTVGKNLTNEQLTGIGTASAERDTIIIGAANSTGSSGGIVSNFSEVLVYKATHDEATANQVINYLIQKWNISV